MRQTLVCLARRVSGAQDPLHSGLGKYTTDVSNLPERYIKRKSTKVKYRSPKGIEFTPKFQSYRIVRHTLDRPWTSMYWSKNPAYGNIEAPVVLPIKSEDWMWFRGDRVEILTGPDKGKQGLINMIVQERNWVTVEGLNCKYSTVGAEGDFPGMMIKEEKPLLVTKDIALVDPSDEKITDVEWRFSESGTRIRVSARTGTTIPTPGQSEETIDYKTKAQYVLNKEKDTKPSVVEDVTYEPKLATFEMDIMDQMGIKETRIPKKTWWY
eukprot:TRINITY_DN568_c0_g1_i1.p1 TRINITY_DN568_c0_g1~~TRINITY_DN568_c0_g1_i1.p1  ORF type:complete len:267 (-),score=27.01 TRINITY_DN568_c0_g1_i1:101-901(-)